MRYEELCKRELLKIIDENIKLKQEIRKLLKENSKLKVKEILSDIK